MAIPAESSFIDLAKCHPPLGWHHQHRHTQWQVSPLGHLSNTDQSSSVQAKPLRQAAQLVGLPAELGDGSGFSNFVEGAETTRPRFSEFQPVSPTPQPDIQPLWQKAADVSQSSFQIAQPADSPKDNEDLDTISETTVPSTIDTSVDNQAKETSSDTLPVINPLQRQPLGQHQPLGFNQPVITETAADDISPTIQPRPVAISPKSDGPPIAQRPQSSDDVTFPIDPETERTSDNFNRTEISSTDAVADALVGTETSEAVDNLTDKDNTVSETATPVQRSLSTQSSDVESPNDLELTPPSDNLAPLDLEPEQNRTGTANIPAITDLPTPDNTETVTPVQRAPEITPDIDTPAVRLLENRAKDVSPIETTPERSQPPDTGEIVQGIAPTETTEASSNIVSEVTEQSQPSLQPSSAEYSEPDSVSEFSAADIVSSEVSPPIQSTTEEVSTVIQPALESSVEPQSFSESSELEPGSVAPESVENDGTETIQLNPESTVNDGIEVIQARTEQASEIQSVSDQLEVPYRPVENIDLPSSEDTSAPMDTAQRMPEISTQEISPVNEPDEVTTAKLTDIQTQPAIPETLPSSPEPIETFQALESVQSDLSQEPTIAESFDPESQRSPESFTPEQVIQQRQIEALPTGEELSEPEIKSFTPEQSFLDTMGGLEQITSTSPIEKPQIISPDNTPSFQTEETPQAQLHPSIDLSTQSDDRPSLVEPESSDRQEVSPQSSAHLPADLPAIQAKLPSAPAIQPLGMHELMVDALKDSPDPLPEKASTDVTALPNIQRKPPQEQKTGLLSPKLAALTSKYGSDGPDDSFWSSAPTSNDMASLLDVETPVETDSIETDPLDVQAQTVSLSVPDAIVEMVEGGKSAHMSSGEIEDQALWQLAHILYSELRAERGVRSRLTSSTFQRASPGLMAVQVEPNKQPHLPLALWPPPMHQLATIVRLQLQTRLRKDFERSGRLSKFI